MRPTDPEGFVEAWTILEGLWNETVARARKLPEEALHENVDGEWSFIQTLRHLAFATDSWVNRVMRGDPRPWHPLDLPFTELGDVPGIPNDQTARPTLDEVLALRASRQEAVRTVLEGLTEEELDSTTQPVTEKAWPSSLGFEVRDVLLLLLNEEWMHRLYAERDLDALEAGEGAGRSPGDAAQ